MGNSTDIYKTETRPNPDSDEALIAAIAEENKRRYRLERKTTAFRHGDISDR